jgi:hypothetical protein
MAAEVVVGDNEVAGMQDDDRRGGGGGFAIAL